MPYATTWPEHADSILKKGWKEGLTGAQISQNLAIAGFRKTRNAVIGRANRLKLPDRKGTNQLKRKATNPNWNVTGKSYLASKARPKPGKEPRPLPLPREVIKITQKIQNEPAPESAKTLMELGPCQCRHPYGQGDYKFCGQPTDGGSYCDKHRTQNYLRGGK